LGDDRELLRRARALDEAALGEIFDTYYPLLYRYTYQHIRHQGRAEELAAEVFTRLLEQLVQRRGPTRHLRAWLYRVAHNLVVDDSRRREHRSHEELDERGVAGGSDVAAEVESALVQEQAQAALQKLTPKQRAVLVLKFLEGYENKEIARMLETTVGAVKALQHRGLAAMRQHLQQAGVRKETL
jgi:RNA polymerase sigma-70 factor (ECF subfamily)